MNRPVINRWWMVVALALLGAASPEENKLFRVAQTAFQDGLYDFAERQLREFVEKFPASEKIHDARWLWAQSQIRQGKWQAAIQTLEDGRVGTQAVDGYLFWTAEAQAAGEQYAPAQKLYEELIQRFPASDRRADAQFGLAFMQLRQGQYEAAQRTLEELARQPQREALTREADLLRGQVLLALEKFKAAEEVFDTLLKSDEKSRLGYRARRWRGELWARQQDWERALRDLTFVTDAYRREPNKPVDVQLAAEAWAATGWVHWRQEQFAQAVDAFALALANARSPSLRREAMLKLAESYVRAGQSVEAIAKLRQFLQERPADPIADEVQWTIADLLFAQNDFAGALAELTKLIATFPQSKRLAQAQFQAGWCAVKLNRPADALPHFEQAFAAAAASGGPAADAALAEQALFKVADLQFETAQLAEAVASYQRLISTFPNTSLMDRALFQLGLVYQRMQNLPGAEHVFESLVTDHPQSVHAPEAQFQIGMLHVAAGQEDRAREAFAKVVAKFPQSSWAGPAQLATGESYYREEKHDAAVAEFQKLIDAAPDSELGQRAFYNRGWCYAAQNQPEKTLAEFTDFLARYPQSALAPEVQFWIADHHYRQKDFVKAQEQFQSLAKSYPASRLADTAEYFAARAAYLRQDYKTAIDLFEALVKSFPQSPLRCEARFGQGDAFAVLNEFDNALQVFDTLVREFPDCAVLCEAQGRKAECLYTLQRYEEAVAVFRLALDCVRDTDRNLRNQLYFKLGKAFEKWGKLDEALEQYLKAVYETAAAADPNEPREQLWVGRAGWDAATILEQRQQWRDAITLYERLIQLCPDMKALLEDRIRKIRVERMILF